MFTIEDLDDGRVVYDLFFTFGCQYIAKFSSRSLSFHPDFRSGLSYARFLSQNVNGEFHLREPCYLTIPFHAVFPSLLFS